MCVFSCTYTCYVGVDDAPFRRAKWRRIVTCTAALTDHSLLFNIVARCCKEYGKQLVVFARKSRYIDICVGGLTNGLFLATSSRASMKILGDLSLPYLVFVSQLTDVVNVTMQLSNVTVLDNCILHVLTGVVEMFVEASRHIYF